MVGTIRVSPVRVVAAVAMAALLAAGAIAPASAAQPVKGANSIVSRSMSGAQGTLGSSRPAISANGRYVAFASDAPNLVVGDTNGAPDIFRVDTVTGAVDLVSRGLNGATGNGSSGMPSISADGRFVAFQSSSSNLVNGDSNTVADVFRWDATVGSSELVSKGIGGAKTISEAIEPDISADGRYVVFTSGSENLVASDTNVFLDVFRRDMQSGETVRASVATGGEQAHDYSFDPSISADGRYVYFTSGASDLVSGDTNHFVDVFRHDTVTGITDLLSHGAGIAQANGSSYSPVSSADGRFVAFSSGASNLVTGDTNLVADIFRVDVTTGKITRVGATQGNSDSVSPSISSDGRFLAFASAASNLEPSSTDGQPDVFLFDAARGSTQRISVALDGGQPNDRSVAPSLSADARFIAFESQASNLVADDTNGVGDIVLRKLFGDAPVITAQPADVSVAAGEAAVLSVGATGDPVPVISWQVSSETDPTWKSAGLTGASVSALAADGARYRALVTNSVGAVTSNTAIVHVATAPTSSTPVAPTAPQSLTPVAPTSIAQAAPAHVTLKASKAKSLRGKVAVVRVKVTGISTGAISARIGTKVVAKTAKISHGIAVLRIGAKYLPAAKKYRVVIAYSGSPTGLAAKTATTISVRRR